MKRAGIFLGIIFFMANCLLAEPVQGWDYQYKVHAPGKRGESTSGSLVYNGAELPEVFNHVITPVGEFLFNSLHGSGGPEIRWTPIALNSKGGYNFASTGEKMSRFLSGEESAFRKCIAGPEVVHVSKETHIPGKFEERPKQAGQDWFFVVKTGWWVNPKKINEVARQLRQ
jgi:hypothetical protein